MNTIVLSSDLQQGALFGFLVGLLLFMLIIPVLRRRYSKESHQKKDEFIALASHYLLTPISIIQAALAPLQEDDGSLDMAARQRLYQMIFLGQQRLWVLSEQIRIVQEIESDHLQVRLAIANLGTIVDEAAGVIYPFAKQKELHLAVRNSITGECRLDSRLIKQALVAVLDNAVKFSQEKGEILLEAYQEGNLLTIIVEDHGIGMDSAVQAHLGEKFYRGNGLYDFNYEGVGLGLHVAWAIVRQHGGNISFDSRIKRGTRVIIELPVD